MAVLDDVLGPLDRSTTIASMRLRDLPGWDSFRSVETVLACESRFSVRIAARQLDEIQTIGDLVSVCSRLMLQDSVHKPMEGQNP
jgi:acyl carrier protein